MLVAAQRESDPNANDLAALPGAEAAAAAFEPPPRAAAPSEVSKLQKLSAARMARFDRQHNVAGMLVVDVLSVCQQDPAPIAAPGVVPPGGGEAARAFSAALKQEADPAGMATPLYLFNG